MVAAEISLDLFRAPVDLRRGCCDTARAWLCDGAAHRRATRCDNNDALPRLPLR